LLALVKLEQLAFRYWRVELIVVLNRIIGWLQIDSHRSDRLIAGDDLGFDGFVFWQS
jgi:hypothetical protein